MQNSYIKVIDIISGQEKIFDDVDEAYEYAKKLHEETNHPFDIIRCYNDRIKTIR